MAMSAPAADGEVGRMSAVSSESGAAKDGRGAKAVKDRAAAAAAATAAGSEGEEGGSNSGGEESSDGGDDSSDDEEVRRRYFRRFDPKTKNRLCATSSPQSFFVCAAAL